MVVDLSAMTMISLIKHVFYNPIRSGCSILEELLEKFKLMSLDIPARTQVQ